VLVEGGPRVARSFLAADLVDEAVIVTGAAPLAQGELPFVDRGLEVLADPNRWTVAAARSIGADRLAVYRARGRLAPDPAP